MYGAEVSLTVNDNALDLFVNPVHTRINRRRLRQDRRSIADDFQSGHDRRLGQQKDISVSRGWEKTRDCQR